MSSQKCRKPEEPAMLLKTANFLTLGTLWQVLLA